MPEQYYILCNSIAYSLADKSYIIRSYYNYNKIIIR